MDLARLPRVEDPAAEVVVLQLSEQVPDRELRAWVAEDWLIAPGDGVVQVPRTALRWVTALAGAGAEQRSPLRDRHQRVPSTVNPMVAAGLEREPVVSQAARTLQRAVFAAAGRRPARRLAPWPNGKRWAAAFTHDLDVVWWWPLFTSLRLVELARKGQGTRFLQAARAALGAAGRDPVWRGASEVLDVDRRHGVAATWFVLCGRPTARTVRAGDLTYLPESARARKILGAVGAMGHEVCLHGSFETMDRAGAFAEQRRRLAGLTGQRIGGVRQHFLRMHPGVTQRAMGDAGFSYDASFGFPDRNGFRLGVADVVPAWDEANQQELPLQETPLIWMDRALSKYRAVEDPQAWVRDGLELAAASRGVEGLWVGLWHPNLVPALGFPGAPAAYGDIVRAVVEGDPFVGTLEEIVAWRRAQRSVRIRGVAADGRVDAYADVGGPAPLILEDSSGRPRETVTSGRAANPVATSR